MQGTVNGFIGRVGMDGTQNTKWVTEKVSWPGGITVDYDLNRVWWVDQHLDHIA